MRVAQMVPPKCRRDEQQAGYLVGLHSSYTHRSCQTSDYHVKNHEEAPELNSIPVQQSHLSLGLILC